jgi:N-acetylmuramoyl-L-alanine amidase
LVNRASSQNGELALSFSAPVVYRTERFNRPDRLVVNLYGVKNEDAARDLTRLKAPWLDRIKTEVILGDSLRLNLYLKDDTSLNVYGVPPTRSLLITPREHDDAEVNGLVSEETRPSRGTRRSQPPPEPEPSQQDVDETQQDDGKISVEGINFENGGSLCRLQIDLTSPIKPQAFLLSTDPARPRLVFDLPNAHINPPEQTINVPDNRLISRIRTGVFDHTVARVVLDLKQKVNFAVTRDNDGARVVLSVAALGASHSLEVPSSDEANTDVQTVDPGSVGGTAPSTEAGSLAGRTIVIDAGHGGHDKGTSGYGLLEKEIALDISKRLYETLKDAGVHAILTRNDDRFIRLPDRPAVANQINADAFVAIHLNSTGSVRNIWSGTETYFHFQDPVCKELARCIQQQLVMAIGLPDRGARSDTTIAKRLGFSVLRNSQVPAVLVEVGYLNHPNDASKLKSPEFRQRAAEGIMAGLRTYFARTQSASRGQ